MRTQLRTNAPREKGPYIVEIKNEVIAGFGKASINPVSPTTVENLAEVLQSLAREEARASMPPWTLGPSTFLSSPEAYRFEQSLVSSAQCRDLSLLPLRCRVSCAFLSI